MADQEILDIYAELYRRNAVPDEHKPVVDELVKRGVIKVDGPKAIYRDPVADAEGVKRNASVADRMVNSATLGTLPNIMAGAETVLSTLPKAVIKGQPIDLGQMYDENLAYRRKIRDASGGGLAADLAGGFLLAPGQALRAAQGAAPTVMELAKTGAKWGAAGAYLGTDGSSDPNATLPDHVLKRAEQVPAGAALGAVAGPAIGLGLPAVVSGARNALMAPYERVMQGVRAPVQQRAAEFTEAGVPVFGPALSDTTAGPAESLMGSVVGGPLRRRAQTSIEAVERGVRDTVAATGGTRPVNEIGTEAQDFLRRQITERNPNLVPENLTPFELQDISGIGPGPRAPRNAPPVPRAQPEPWNPQRRAVTPEDVDRAMPPVERPQTPAPRSITLDDVPLPNELSRRLEDTRAAAESARPWLADNEAKLQTLAASVKSAPGQYGGGMSIEYKAQQGYRLTPIEQQRLNEFNQLNDLVTKVRGVVAEHEAAATAAQSYRAANFRQLQDAELARVSSDAEANYQLRVAEARRATEERLGRVADAEYLNDLNDPVRRTAFENRARNAARADTERRQNQADLAYQAELEQRQAAAIPDRVGGRSREPYNTEFDAGYEAARRNTPPMQMNPLGRPGDTRPTETVRLLDEIATDFRRQGLLPGYKSGNLFGDDGRVIPEVLSIVDRLGGPGVAERIRAISDMRPRGATQLGIEGLDKIRTAIGRALADARQRPIGGLMQGEGAAQRDRAAFLSGLYDAVGRDVDRAVASVPGGGVAAQQRTVLRESYKEFMEEIRGPLSRVFGQNTTPEQAVRMLTDAARSGDRGNFDLLNAYFRVATEKGDRVRATGVLLNDMVQDGVEGFLRSWRSMSPEVRALLAQGDSAPIVSRLDQLARVGGYLERFVARARPDQSAADMARRAASTQNVLTGLLYFVNAPSALAAVVGQAGASKIMASASFQRWLQKVPQARTPQETAAYIRRMSQIAAAQMGGNKDLRKEVRGAMGAAR